MQRVYTIYYIPLLSLTTILNLKEEQNKIIDIYKKTNYRPTLQVRFHLLIASNKLLSKLFRYIKHIYFTKILTSFHAPLPPHFI